MERFEPHPQLAEEQVLAVLSRGAARNSEQLKYDLSQVFPRLRLVAPTSLEHFIEIVAGSDRTHKVVIAVGGDGTLHQALKHIAIDEQILGVLPQGTGNDLATHLDFPAEPKARIARLSQAQVHNVDYGTIAGIPFHNSAGFGIDSATLKIRNYATGLLAKHYNLAFMKALSGMQCPELTARLGTEQLAGRFYWVLAMNSPLIGGGTRIAPQAVLDDGQLDFMLVKGVGKLKMLSLLPKAVRGEHIHLDMVVYRQGTSLVVEQAEPIEYLAVDGELYPYGKSKVEWTVVPAGLKLLY